MICNSKIMERVKEIRQDEDLDYGYQKTTSALQLAGFYINHKKVYRLMKNAHLLKDKQEKPSKVRVKYRKVFPKRPLEVLEMDIKFVWIEEYKRHAYVLTVIDTFTRVVLHWTVAYLF